MNVMAKLCDDMGVSAIITTNSPSVIQRVPLENVILLAREQGASEVVRRTTTAQLATILGGGAAFRGAVIVEDQAAKDFTSAMFDEIMPDLDEVWHPFAERFAALALGRLAVPAGTELPLLGA